MCFSITLFRNSAFLVGFFEVFFISSTGLALTNSNNPTPQDESQNSALCTRVCSWQIRWDSETEVTQHVGRPQTCFGKICSYRENVYIAFYIFISMKNNSDLQYFFCKKNKWCVFKMFVFLSLLFAFLLFCSFLPPLERRDHRHVCGRNLQSIVNFNFQSFRSSKRSKQSKH